MSSKVVAVVALGAFITVGLAGDLDAFEELIPTKVCIVKFGGSPAIGKLYKLVSKAPKGGAAFALPTSSPATTGASVTVSVGTGTLGCTLAAGAYDGTVGWKELGNPPGTKGYKYLNSQAPSLDPCKVVIVKEKVIKVVVKGTGSIGVPQASGNPDISTVVRLGTDDYCAYATMPHFKEKEGKLIKAKDQLAPLACPGILPTTTTTGPSTTSTSNAPTTSTTEATTTTTTLPPPPLDHYRVYGTNPFPDGPVVTLEDQFQTQVVDLGPVSFFMVPASKEEEPIFDLITHLACYLIPEGAFAATVDVDNQFGPQTLAVLDPAALCVPTEKNPGEPPLPLRRDHYKCYDATGASPGAPPVRLEDQFQTETNVVLLSPFFFCNPVDKNGEGILSPEEHLTCYTSEPLSGFLPGETSVRNQFNGADLDVFEASGLCVPSVKLAWTPVTTTTTGQPTTTTVPE